MSSLYLTKLAAALKNCTPELAKTDKSCQTTFPNITADSAQVQHILQLVFGVIGAVAVIIIVLAGFKFVTANGNPEKISTARQAIIFAAIGLAVVASAEIIVTFVLGRI